MKLYPKDYKEKNVLRVISDETKDNVRDAIKNFVKVPTEYCDIITFVQKSYALTNDEIVDLIREVDNEWNLPEEIKEVM